MAMTVHMEFTWETEAERAFLNEQFVLAVGATLTTWHDEDATPVQMVEIDMPVTLPPS